MPTISLVFAGYLFKGCRPVPPTPGFGCGFRATKNIALGFVFLGFFLTQMASEARCRFDSDA